jgi:hypothetical protein
MGYFDLQPVPWPDAIANYVSEKTLTCFPRRSPQLCARIITASGLKLNCAGSFRAHVYCTPPLCVNNFRESPRPLRRVTPHSLSRGPGARSHLAFSEYRSSGAGKSEPFF